MAPRRLLSLLHQSRSPLSGYPRRLIRDSARIAPPGAIFDRKRRASYWPLGQWAIANFARHDDWPSPHEQFARSLGKSPRRSDRSLDMLDYGPIEHFPRYLLTIAHCGHAWAANPIPRHPCRPGEETGVEATTEESRERKPWGSSSHSRWSMNSDGCSSDNQPSRHNFGFGFASACRYERLDCH